MPVHVGQMTSEVTLLDGDLPLSEPQIDKLVQRVLQRLEEQRRDQHQSRQATTIRRQAAPPPRADL
jgi:hypothetical protein